MDPFRLRKSSASQSDPEAGILSCPRAPTGRSKPRLDVVRERAQPSVTSGESADVSPVDGATIPIPRMPVGAWALGWRQLPRGLVLDTGEGAVYFVPTSRAMMPSFGLVTGPPRVPLAGRGLAGPEIERG